MMTELIQEMKSELLESPGIAGLLALAIVVGFGCNAVVVGEADGSELRVTASKSQSIEDQANRLRWSACSAQLKPGFTILLGLQQYSVEVSVPLTGMRSLVQEVRSNVAETVRGICVERAA